MLRYVIWELLFRAAVYHGVSVGMDAIYKELNALGVEFHGKYVPAVRIDFCSGVMHGFIGASFGEGERRVNRLVNEVIVVEALDEIDFASVGIWMLGLVDYRRFRAAVWEW